MPDVEHGKFGVYWALNQTIKLAPGLVENRSNLLCFAKLVDSGEPKSCKTLKKPLNIFLN